jgi:hypothetical protein
MKTALCRPVCLVLALIFLAGLSGCVGPATYEKAGIFGTGYTDKDLGGGLFEVVFVGKSRTMDFVKFAALYRSAEITYEHSFHFFTVTKVADMSTGADSPKGGAAQAASSEMPGIKYTFQATTQKYAANYYDAYMILDRYNVPGTQALHTVAQRQAEALKAQEQEQGVIPPSTGK